MVIVLLILITTIIFFIFKKDKYIEEIDLRHMCESYIELRLYNSLKKKGYKPIPQYRCGPYRIDLVLYHHRIAIECDGKEFHSTPEQKRYDARKNRYLKKNGWKVCRISGKSINNNIGGVIKHIEKRAHN